MTAPTLAPVESLPPAATRPPIADATLAERALPELPYIRVGRTQIDARQYGLDGSGHADDATGWAQLIADAPDGADIHVEGKPTFLLVNGLQIADRRALRITSDRIPFPDGANVPHFVYAGADNQHALIYLYRCLNTVLEGFFLELDDQQGKQGRAKYGVLLDGGADTGHGEQRYGSACRMQDLRSLNWRENDDVIHFAIAQVTKENQEFHEFVRVAACGNGGGRFLDLGPSFNDKSIRVILCSAVGFDRAIHMSNGSLHMYVNNFTANNWNLYFEGATEVSTEIGTTTENSLHHAYYGTQILSMGGRWDPSHCPPNDDWIRIGAGAGFVSLKGAMFDCIPAARGARCFGFEDEANRRVTRLEDIEFPWCAPPAGSAQFSGTTRQRVGLDRDTLSGVRRDGSYQPTTRGAGSVIGDGLRGLQDLPGGSFRFNAPTLEEYSPHFWSDMASADATYTVDARGHLVMRRYYGGGAQPAGPNAVTDNLAYEEIDLGQVSRVLR